MTANASSGTVDPAEVVAAIAADPELAEQVVAAIADTDNTLAANSDSRLATQKATKGYVTTQTGLLVPKSLVDAKGDLLVGTAPDTVARKAVGSNGKVLVADSTQGDGLSWGYLSDITAFASVGAYDTEVLADTPALYFKGAPASGTTAVDSSGNGKDATMSGNVAPGTALLGDGNSAFEFTSTGGTVARGSSTSDLYSDNDTRVSVWEAIVRFAGLTGATTNSMMFFGSPNGSGPGIQMLGASAASSSLGQVLRVSGATTREFPVALPGNGETFHLALRIDAVNKWAKLYVNGRLVGRNAFTAWTAGGYRYQFGSSFSAGNPFLGRLNHVAIYHQDVSAARIRAHAYAAGLYDPFA